MILVINAGSSSLKYQLFRREDKVVLARGLCERIGIDGRVKHQAPGKEQYVADVALPDHAAAIREVTNLLTDAEQGVIGSMEEIVAVGHRVVHGGEYFSDSVVVTDEVLAAIEACVPLAPLHNPANLTGIRACQAELPGVPMVAVFDTAFHQSMKEKAFIYPIPYEYYTQFKIRRYGFHGTSHRYVAERAALLVKKPLENLKIVTCHLGNGSSITAVRHGKSMDTSMGFTPLAGIPMGTRAGNVDPAILSFLVEHTGQTVFQVLDTLNKKSGMLGISGVSSDFRDLDAAAAKGDQRALLALEVFAYRTKKAIGSYAAAMGGIDVLVFTAGVGENNARMRECIASGLEFMGLALDTKCNATTIGEERIVSLAGSPGKIAVIPTNEELVIVNDTERLIQGQ